jgi:arginase
MKHSRKIIDIIGVPSDFGANIEGALMGPAALRTAGLHEKLQSIGRKTQESGDIPVPNRYNLPTEKVENNYVSIVQEICQDLKTASLKALAAQNIPLVLGGDHSIVIGSLAATCTFYKKDRIGLLWVDTHADINTPQSSHTGNIHGMPISVLLGKGHAELTQLFDKQTTIQPENIVLLGLRDIDSEEKGILKKSGITFYTMRDIDEKGIRKIVKEICKHQFKDIEGLHLSFDIDVMNPPQIPGVSTPVPGGLTLREAHLLLEMLYETQNIIAADFVELNPFKDIQGQSAAMAVDLICSLFGKRII